VLLPDFWLYISCRRIVNALRTLDTMLWEIEFLFYAMFIKYSMGYFHAYPLFDMMPSFGYVACSYTVSIEVL